MTRLRKAKVDVVMRCHGVWDVWIDGPDCSNEVKSIIVASYSTRDAANLYAKPLRRALRGDTL